LASCHFCHCVSTSSLGSNAYAIIYTSSLLY
jgi:hypothetical protein